MELVVVFSVILFVSSTRLESVQTFAKNYKRNGLKSC